MSEKISCQHCGSTKVSARIIYPGPASVETSARLAIECHACKLATSEIFWETLAQHLGEEENTWLQWGEVA